MNRRGFLAALSALPFMKWVKPKVRPKAVAVYFQTEKNVMFTCPASNVITSVGSSTDGRWIPIDVIMKNGWGDNG